MSQSPEAAALIDEGMAAHQAGDLARAQEKYAQALALAPDDPEALHLMGVLRAQLKDRNGAIDLIARAVAADPGEALFRINLAMLLTKEKHFVEALPHVLAGLNLKPEDRTLWMLRGDIEFALGNIGEAKTAVQTALRLAPDETDALTLAMRIAKRENDSAAIIEIANKWRNAHAGDRGSVEKLATLLFDLGFWKEARDTLAPLLERNPDDVRLLIPYGRYSTAARDYDKALDAIEKALLLEPKSAAGLYALSRVKFYLGDLAEAEALSARAVEEDPALIPAWLQLSDLREDAMTDEELEAMKRIAADAATKPDDAYTLWIAIGNVLHARGETAKAFDAFKTGNDIGEEALNDAGAGYDADRNRAFTDSLISLFPSDAATHTFDPAPVTPFFVVGMPRSGTTLIESMLAAHPDVFGAGELPNLPAILAAVVNNGMPKARLQELRDAYFADLPDTGGARYIVDKQPFNFQAAGLIRILFPEARIVHIRRNPIETGFSIYRRPFNPEWFFARKLENIAAYYGDYARLCHHWEKTLGDAFPLFQYETLIANFEAEARRLLAHCGLDWHDGVLAFHKSDRPVHTFSSLQVRKPLEANPEDLAARYKDHLKPLAEGLSAANVDLNNGAFNYR